MEIEIKLDVSLQNIVDCLASATYTSTYWCRYLGLPKTYTTPEAQAQNGWDGKGWMELFTNPDAEAEVHDDDSQYDVTHASAIRGVQLFAEKAPRHFRDLISEDHDGDTADVLFQYIAMADHIYG